MSTVGERPELERASVLLVDDEPMLLSSMRRSLKRSPADVRLAASADEALVLVAAETPDLVVSDYRMPGALTGLDLLMQVLELHPKVLCVLHTAELQLEIPACAAIEILAKPCSDATFGRLVDRVLAARRAMQ
jgi:DNA-binding NtrC family response regulator